MKKVAKSASKGKTASLKKVAKLQKGKGRVSRKSTANKPEEDPDTVHQDSPVPKRNKMMGSEEIQEFTKSIMEQFKQTQEQSTKTLTDTLKQEINCSVTLKLDNIIKNKKMQLLKRNNIKKRLKNV